MGQALATTASADILYRTIKQDRSSYTARQANGFGMIYDREKRVSVLRDAKDVIESMRKKSTAERLMNVFLETGTAKPKTKRNKKELSVHDIGNRFITIATAASIMMGGLFITEHVVGIIDSAHASQTLDRFHR